MKLNLPVLFILTATLFSPACMNKSPFTTRQNDEGVELLENGKPVFFYQKAQKTLAGKYVVSNYLHPVYSLNGDTLTQESPADHLFHRGVFWAWHQLSVNGDSVGDGWVMENIRQEVKKVDTKIDNNTAKFSLDVLWKSSMYKNGEPFIEENTDITVYPAQPDVRKIDFEIRLKALVPGVEMGGSNDEKGYGGFCTRVKLPSDLVFTSINGPVKAQNLQLTAGSWMDFSGSYKQGDLSGVAILCHPTTPNYPAPWILRDRTSMQNIVFPGRQKISVPTDKPIVLRYRLIIHNGDMTKVNLPELQGEYNKVYTAK